MYYVYIIESLVSDKYYIGYTKDYKLRWNSHKHASKCVKSKLYNHMRKYGIGNFELILIDRFFTKEEAIRFEISLISLDDNNCLNLAPGGEGGFTISNIEGWKNKLSAIRQGAKPALGMKHTEENKKLFSSAGKKRWDIYRRYSLDVLNYSFKEANKLYGISKTHYYRLLKQNKSNELI